MLIDTSAFPLVYLRDDHQSTPAGAGEAQLGALLDRGECFVLLTDHLPGDHDHDEAPEERKQRALFFKRNKERMRALCRGIVIITGDRALSTPIRLAVKGAGKALGVDFAFVSTELDAQQAAERFLASA